MTDFEKRIFIALGIAAVVMLLNIIAVTHGLADGFYANINEWLFSLKNG